MLLSIIIPTKNRYTTLFSVVDMILSFNVNEDIEIVVQDNSDNNQEALAFIEERKKYVNLKYFHSFEKLSVIENSDRAVLNSSGEYVCFIGDDDGIMPNILEVTNWMKENGYKALKSYKPSYYWPNQKSNILSNDSSGVLKFKKWKNKSYKIIQSDTALEFALNRGGVTIASLPCLYHGIVEKKTLDKIFSKTKTYFPGPSPDMANAIALTQVIDSFVYVSYPVVISGKSTMSTGGAGVLHQHIAKIEDVKHLPKETAERWDSRIPKYWTGPTIWAESVIKCLENFQNYDSISKFNFDYLYSHILVFNRNFSNIIFQNFNLEITNKIRILKLQILLFRISTFIKNRIGIITKINNLKSMNSVINILSKY